MLVKKNKSVCICVYLWFFLNLRMDANKYGKSGIQGIRCVPDITPNAFAKHADSL